MNRKEIKDFLETLHFHGYIDHDITKLDNLIDDYFPKQLQQADVIGTLPLYKIEGLIKALTDIKDWDDDLEDEWEDQGYRAKAALNEWTA